MRILAGYLLAASIITFCVFLADKYRAVKRKRRIPERVLLILSAIGGAPGAFIAMYLLRHKTRKMLFVILIPLLVIAQLSCLLFVRHAGIKNAERPSSIVSAQLEQIKELDEETINSFVNSAVLSGTGASQSLKSPDSSRTIYTFFKDFDYEIISEQINGDSADVKAQITNLDTRSLARDLCMKLTASRINSPEADQTTATGDDYFALLGDALDEKTYDLVSTDVDFHLVKEDKRWKIQEDASLQDHLVGGLDAWLKDPYLLLPEEVLSIYMDRFSSFGSAQWMEYLDLNDVFSTYSQAHYEELDKLYTEKIALYFDYAIVSAEEHGNTAQATVNITSIDMPAIMTRYREQLLNYAASVDSITSDQSELTDATAQYLLDTIKEYSTPLTTTVDVSLVNEGRGWILQVNDALADAILGNITGALTNLAGTLQ